MEFLDAFSRFWQEFISALPTLLLYLVPAWVVCLVVLTVLFRALKPHIRLSVLRLDEIITEHARALRYRLPVKPEDHPAAPQTPPTALEALTERVRLTWFFRFWTNFGSSPSLGIFSLLIAILAFAPQAEVLFPEPAGWWFFPGLAFAGGMWLSFVTKRLFKRLRPQREDGSFGHKLNDPSFPSGHSLTSICFWGGIVATLITVGASATVIIAAGVLGLAIIALTGLSRIYLGVHWPSDVGGGYLLGFVWLVVCYFVLYGVL